MRMIVFVLMRPPFSDNGSRRSAASASNAGDGGRLNHPSLAPAAQVRDVWDVAFFGSASRAGALARRSTHAPGQSRARTARGLPRDQRNAADTAGQHCLGSRSRPRAVSALPPCVRATVIATRIDARTQSVVSRLSERAGGAVRSGAEAVLPGSIANTALVRGGQSHPEPARRQVDGGQVESAEGRVLPLDEEP